MTYRILFVDDDPNILSGLRRMLHSMREEWEMTFVESGQKALTEMDTQRFDAVVSDMRMPGMDGATLLNIVRKRHPETVRIVLSGFAHQEAIMRTVGPAHQYLAKPCNREELINTVRHAAELRKLLKSPELMSLVAGLEHLPTPPKIYFDLMEELASPRGSAASVSAIIEKDMALLAQTLKLTNSAYFGLPRHITTALDAVRLLGFDTVKALVLMAGFFTRLNESDRYAAEIERLSARCIIIGRLSAAIAEAERSEALVVNESRCAGLLSHIGTLVLLYRWPERYAESARIAEAKEIEIDASEQEVFGASHADLGAYLLGLWGFGDPIVEAIAFHHKPQQCPRRAFSPLTAVHVAQSLAVGMPPTDGERAFGPKVNETYLEEAGVAGRLPVWQEIRDRLAESNG